MQMHCCLLRRLTHAGSAALLALTAVIAAGGCVQRRLTIRSNPPGARVYVGDEEIGTTPVSTDFVYYGTRKIRLVKPGYETLVVNQPIPAPWYQIPPLDFVSETLVPGEIRDERVVNFELVPMRPVATDQFLARGEQLRRATGVQQVSAVAPATAPVIVPATPPPGAAAPPMTLPEPVTQAPLQNSPTGQTPIFAPPGGGPVATPPAGVQPASPTIPPSYNPPQYLPPG